MNKRIAEFISNLADENENLERKVKAYKEIIDNNWELLRSERERVKQLKRKINALKKEVAK